MSILCDHVFKKFRIGVRGKIVQAVSDVSVSVNQGDVFGIIGPNGAGKSTLLKLFMGFIKPTFGKISILGKSPDNPQCRSRLGYLPENPCFYEHLSAIELMRFSAEVSGLDPKKTNEEIIRLLKFMNIEHAGNRKLRGYSKGMVQRAGICFALIHDPELIILDEPMSGLDPVGRKLLVDLVLDLKARGKTILFCSHILNDVERLCDRIAIMHNGELKKILNRKDLIDQENQVCIRLETFSKELSDDMDILGVRYAKEGNATIISCSRNQLKDSVNMALKHGIRVEELNISTHPLEKLFMDTISDESV
ncbi:ABC transporter ATP-binding protein [Desulfobacula toluolica]|uniref:ABC transporter ATP-binding protein n=1 Tax=Desulfobacula toluolica TaxID=28223 RepID=UPI0002D2F3D3|nr:ABC transporter ATP-binding protein [Desulfobacula toluolica]